ncbi:FAD:protein FMN transferase [Aliiroseovarius pelagivivens]|uniref:FAD:protein FMN transferase n=1 Tax=Aliiroseovarius pelagivivens TaxID=1639690 RepID=A0A2R8AJ88_9RHOB|nr:FAD:protein FMN transferase [Aliiroseovarius pelagivivens]SPF76105.1 FAD:protein FMN transferase [Aliiroseovarius pelagivivens]
MTRFDRRRFLTITAAAMALPGAAAAASVARWTGRALGGPVSMQLAGLNDAEAQPIFAAVEAELTRLEAIFSLYQDSSELVRLNRDGQLSAPSPELLSVLSLCSALHSASDGAFDPSIQPLWRAIALNKEADEVSRAKQAVGWLRVRFDTSKVRLPDEGALTLNGIAQGAITDAVVDLLKSHGLQNVLVDMGEIAAVGNGPNGPWNIGVALPDGTLVHRLTAQDRAVATSVPNAMTIGSEHCHILTPTGARARAKIASVSAPRAVLADGLSTALCLVPADRSAGIIQAFNGARLEYLEQA